MAEEIKDLDKKTEKEIKTRQRGRKSTKTKIKPKEEIEEIKTIVCVHHGGRALSTSNSNFYKAGRNSVYRGVGYIPFCKKCVDSMYLDYLSLFKNARTAVWNVCRKLDIAFLEADYAGAEKRVTDDYEGDKTRMFSMYMATYNSLTLSRDPDLNFDGSDEIKAVGQEINPVQKKADVEYLNELASLEEFTDIDYQNRSDIMRILGKDPYAGRPKAIQKVLYDKILPYLDEDTVEDSFKVDIIIQIVELLAQIELVNRNLSTELIQNAVKDRSTKIKELTEQKSKLSETLNKIAKDNAISIASRKEQGSGRGTLGYKIRQLRELGFQDAEADYFDQKTYEGFKAVADISNKSIMEQVFLDENDWSEMVQDQRKRVQELQEAVDKYMEENRKLKEQKKYLEVTLANVKQAKFG